MSRLPPPSLRHLAHLTDEVGIVEHARLDRPCRDLGYCTDDAGRLLAVASKLPGDPNAHRLATVALRFLGRAHDGAASFRLRLGPDGLGPPRGVPCGWVLRDDADTLHIYYGAADTVVCVAEASLAALLDHLEQHPCPPDSTAGPLMGMIRPP